MHIFVGEETLITDYRGHEHLKHYVCTKVLHANLSFVLGHLFWQHRNIPFESFYVFYTSSCMLNNDCKQSGGPAFHWNASSLKTSDPQLRFFREAWTLFWERQAATGKTGQFLKGVFSVCIVWTVSRENSSLIQSYFTTETTVYWGVERENMFRSHDLLKCYKLYIV